MNKILMGLNKEQLEAVTTTEGYVRVIAGAGSGKTRALTTRYAYLVDELDISPNRILSVTFTNKAANEMKARINHMIGGDIATPYIMTFHGFCNRFLHSEIEVLGISKNFKIMDVDDQVDMLKVVYNELGLTNTDFPYKRALTEIIGAGCKNGQRTYLSNYEELLEKSSSYELHNLMQIAPNRELKIIYGYLREQKRDACLDYEDLLNMALYVLKTRKEVRDMWENVFDYIQVDEFQDVSLREVELLGILSNKCGNLFVVGDDSQCIIAGSQVRGKYGVERNIDGLNIGDEVLSGVGNGEVESFKIDAVFMRDYNGKVISIYLQNGNKLTLTPEHKLFACRNSLKQNSVYLEYFGNVAKDVGRDNATYTYGHNIYDGSNVTCVTDFDKAGEYAHIIADREEKDLVVNARLIPQLPSELCRADELKVGDSLPIYLDYSVKLSDIVDIKIEDYNGKVYDINVPNSRNFFVNNILVHNCIYSFRGSDVNCIVQFEAIMNKLQNRENKVHSVYLTTNYRSTPQILDVSNALIKHNINRVDKDLIANKGNGARVLHYHARNVYNEADWVARRILSLKKPYSDIAILYRSNTSSRTLEEKLIENGIPYEVLSGISFYSRKEIKDVLALLSVVAFGDNLSFMRTIKTLSLGIGPKKIELLKELSGGKFSLFETLSMNIDHKTFKSTKAKWLVELVEDLKRYAEVETISMLMGRVYTALNLEELYKNSEVERWENLQELKRSAQHYEHNQREKVELGNYLSMLSLYTSSDEEETPNKVKLMTIHAAKGLEYPIVFVVDMNEGIMPSSRTTCAAMMEEERRIAYVAMTRAKELLFMVDAEGSNYDNTYRLPSRFIFNIPRDKFDSEGKIDEMLIRQLETKVNQDKGRFGEATSSILDTITDRTTITQGTRIRHKIFGEGTVMQIVNDAYVVMFDEVGIKGIKTDSNKIEKI